MKFFIILFSRCLCVFLFCRFDTPVHHMVASKARFGENASRRLLRDVASRDRPVCQPCHVIITSRHSLPIFRRKPSQICVCRFWRLGIDLDLSLSVTVLCLAERKGRHTYQLAEEKVLIYFYRKFEDRTCQRYCGINRDNCKENYRSMLSLSLKNRLPWKTMNLNSDFRTSLVFISIQQLSIKKILSNQIKEMLWN